MVVAGSKLEAYYRRDILPSFALAFAKIAAACRALSCEVRGTRQKQARRLCHATSTLRQSITPHPATVPGLRLFLLLG